VTGTLASSCALAHTAPMDLGASLRFLGARAIPGVEEFAAGRFTRTLDLPGGPALLTISSEDGAVACELTVTDEHDRPLAQSLARRLLDLDADPARIRRVLTRDPALARLLRARPGLRSPGAVDGFEMAVRAVVGQQISVAGARTVLGRIAARYGRAAFGQQWQLFPRAAHLAAADPQDLPMPRARGRTLVALATAVASGELTLAPGTDWTAARATLLRVPGIGPWTTGYVCMRALGDPDVLLATDLGVRKAAAALSLPLEESQHSWAPWRSYVTHHLWATLQ
jgi:AraC family transcriptional regulator of adaptative response / DNA-3-methyladenine glycosylase II